MWGTWAWICDLGVAFDLEAGNWFVVVEWEMSSFAAEADVVGLVVVDEAVLLLWHWTTNWRQLRRVVG